MLIIIFSLLLRGDINQPGDITLSHSILAQNGAKHVLKTLA